MFGKIQISLMRAFFWMVSPIVYWGLIFLAWWDSRFKVFLWSHIIARLSERKSYSSIMEGMEEVEGQVWTAMSSSGAMEPEFFMVPLIMAVTFFMAPFVARRDLKAPASGFFTLPYVTLMCFAAVSLINLLLISSINGGIYYILLKRPGPDFFMFLIHPLYLFFPLFKSVPGFLSQCLYLVFIASVLSAPNMPQAEDAPGDDYWDDGMDPDDDWDRSACVMEMDRLTRILNSRFEAPELISEVGADIAEYINRPSQARGDVKLGIAHYKIVLTEAKNSLQRIASENRCGPVSEEAFIFVVNEMERMSYMSAEDAAALRASIHFGPREGVEETPPEKTD
ncbi:MAG: hypothetical protein LBS75_10125 [Synergistaceae bacterium]|jgi:hypothetical protein|nr:hypothetical protein [Synergistaceae bacterium]